MFPLPDEDFSSRSTAAPVVSFPRKACRAASVAVLGAALVCGPGCGKPEPQQQQQQPRGESIRRIDVAGLPPLRPYEPPLDSGRVEIAGPAGWRVAPRYGDYVIRFQGSDEELYPMILVTAEDHAGEALTAETVGPFAQQAAPKGAKPVAIGSCVGAVYLKHGKDPRSIDQVLDRLFWTGVLAGRRYTLELRTRQGQSPQYEKLLFAVAAGLQPAGGAEQVAADAGEKAAETVQKTADAGEKTAKTTKKVGKETTDTMAGDSAPKPAPVSPKKKPAGSEDPDLKGLEELFK
ncbi:MAG: hypothetical protein PHO07_20335 [Pirellulales bacterium]|nr:hypothetical protein [Pirellulales bacterium]